MSRFVLLATLAAWLLIGCSKKAIYTPERIDDRLSYSDRTPLPMQESWLGSGATLEDGSIFLPAAGRESFGLGAEFRLVGVNGPWRLMADRSGTLKAIDTQSGARHKLTLSQPVLSAATDGSVVATISRDNSHRLHDLHSGEVVMLVRERPTMTITTQIAPPLIGADQVIFGTLDGKLLVVDRDRNRVVLERVVGTDSHFGNVRFMVAHDHRIIAATAGRIISLGLDGTTETLSVNVRTLSLLPSGLYLFSTEGHIKRLSSRLETLDEHRIPFARILAAHEQSDRLYLMERSGYLITLRTDLSDQRIYELPDTLSAPLLISPEYLYHHRKGIRWP